MISHSLKPQIYYISFKECVQVSSWEAAILFASQYLIKVAVFLAVYCTSENRTQIREKKMILSFLLSTDLNHIIVLISSEYGKKITEILQFFQNIWPIFKNLEKNEKWMQQAV